MTATLHVAAASVGLLLGLAVLLSTKGTTRHRIMGGTYATILVVVNVAGLLTHNEAQFGVFHALAVVSLTTVLAGVATIAVGRSRPTAIAWHAYLMAWSYAGLVAAGVGQLATSAVADSRVSTLGAIAAALAASAVLISWRVPRILASLLP